MFIASKEHGNEVARYELDDVPTWDGMSAADGKLFVSLKKRVGDLFFQLGL